MASFKENKPIIRQYSNKTPISIKPKWNASAQTETFKITDYILIQFISITRDHSICHRIYNRRNRLEFPDCLATGSCSKILSALPRWLDAYHPQDSSIEGLILIISKQTSKKPASVSSPGFNWSVWGGEGGGGNTLKLFNLRNGFLCLSVVLASAAVVNGIRLSIVKLLPRFKRTRSSLTFVWALDFPRVDPVTNSTFHGTQIHRLQEMLRARLMFVSVFNHLHLATAADQQLEGIWSTAAYLTAESISVSVPAEDGCKTD